MSECVKDPKPNWRHLLRPNKKQLLHKTSRIMLQVYTIINIKITSNQCQNVCYSCLRKKAAFSPTIVGPTFWIDSISDSSPESWDGGSSLSRRRSWARACCDGSYRCWRCPSTSGTTICGIQDDFWRSFLGYDLIFDNKIYTIQMVCNISLLE